MVIAAFFAAVAVARTFCNPMSIPDVPISAECANYSNGTLIATLPKGEIGLWRQKDGLTRQFRSLADPMVLVEGNRWYLYPSYGLLWFSDDCGGTWRHARVDLPDKIAPGVTKFRGRYYMAFSHKRLWVGETPTGPFKSLGRFDRKSFGDDPLMPFYPGDPVLFADGDHLYLYWGVCNKPKSFWGVELDPENPVKAKAPARCLMEFDPVKYPWISGLVEGAWVFKREGRYYFVYSTYGTVNPNYCLSASIGDSPLGPFVPQKRNPFLQTPTGVVTGTGHGSVFADASGDWWVNYCVVVGAYHCFERLIGQDRLAFDADGDISVMRATSTPQWLPSSGRTGDTGWSALPAKCPYRETTDGSLASFRVFNGKLPKTVDYDFGGRKEIRAFRLVWRDFGLDAKRGVKPGAFQYRIDCRENGEWRTWVDASENSVDLLVDYREGPATSADAVRLVILGAPDGIIPAVSEFTVFGEECDR